MLRYIVSVKIECERKEGIPVRDKDDLKKEREKFFDQLESDKEKMINESNLLFYDSYCILFPNNTRYNEATNEDMCLCLGRNDENRRTFSVNLPLEMIPSVM